MIGRSVEGRPIVAEYWGPDRPRNTIVVVAQIHGNECSPTLFVDAVRRTPPVGYGMWLVPTLNPDGYAAYERRNANSVDLNADGGRFTQPESQALYQLVSQVRPVLTLHLHSPNGFAGAHPTGAALATGACRLVAGRTPIRCSEGGAGYRADRSRWFLWQGLQQLGGESLLIELFAVSDAEVPTARPRPPTRSVAEVGDHVAEILRLLEDAL